MGKEYIENQIELATTNRAGRRLVPYRLSRLYRTDFRGFVIFFGIIGVGGVVVVGI